MRNLPPPSNRDETAFESLANNSRVKSYPHLKPISNSIKLAYAEYALHRGNPSLVANLAVSGDQAKILNGHYSSPPADVSYIRRMREESAHKACPMCGSMHSGTLDHYLPKKKFPAFSLLSLNLVPACLCNGRRKEVLVGANPGERILHPYYDPCLSERLIRAKIEDLGEVPRIGVALLVPDTHPSFSAIQFHFDQIVKKAGIRGFFADRWSDLLRRPSLIVREFGYAVPSLAAFHAALDAELDRLDDMYQSKNNWLSAFLIGLSDPPVAAWLFQRLSDPARAYDGPIAAL